MKTNLYVLHYSDAETHPKLGTSNLCFNEVLLRCVSSIREWAGRETGLTVTIVDNGSPPDAHADMLSLLARHGYEERCIWVRENWHPVPVGENAAIRDFLASDAEWMVHFANDTKIGPNFVEAGLKMMGELGSRTFGVVNATFYAIGDVERYRTPLFWDRIKHTRHESSEPEVIRSYFRRNNVRIVDDSWGEPIPISRPLTVGPDPLAIAFFFAHRDAVEGLGEVDERWLGVNEKQVYSQATEQGLKAVHLSSVYISHKTALYRGGNAVGAYHPDQYRRWAPDKEHLVWKDL